MGHERAKVRAFERRWKRAPDLCNLFSTGLTTDGHSGHKPSDSPVATNIPCVYELLSAPSTAIVEGGISYEMTHRIEMEATDTTRAIGPHYTLKVLARGANPELKFEQPVRDQKSFDPVVNVRARLVFGFDQPGIV